MANGEQMSIEEWGDLQPGDVVHHHKRTTLEGKPLMGKLGRFTQARGLWGWLVHWESGGVEKLVSRRLLLSPRVKVD